MDDEFALCWNNFQDNIAAGFQNLYDRGDLVDVTLACDGKLLQAHKIVLAICSPYFQEMFVTNPCKHPIIVLKDVGYSVMTELLQFMYQGVVNVKHTELSSFMKIAQTLQIKGLATSSQKSPSYTPTNTTNKTSSGSASSGPSGHHSTNSGSGGNENQSCGGNVIETKINSSIYSMNKSLSENQSTSSGVATNLSTPSSSYSSVNPAKRMNEYNITDPLSSYPKRMYKRTSEHGDNDMNSGDSMDHMSSDEFMAPQISMIEPKFDLSSVKRELGGEMPSSPGSSRNCIPPPFNFDYNMYQKPPVEYPNELHMGSDYSKGAGNHMDIPAVAPGEKWKCGKLEFMLSQRGKPLLVHDGHTFGIQYIRKDKKYWQCNLSRKFNCKARVTTTDTGEIIVTNNEHCHTEIRQHLRKDYHRNKLNSSGHHSNGSNSSNVATNLSRNADISNIQSSNDNSDYKVGNQSI